MMDKKLMREIKTHRWLFILSVFFNVCSSAAILLQTYLIAVLVNAIFLQHASFDQLKMIFIYAFFAMIGRFIFDCLEDYFSLKLAKNIQVALRQRIIDKLGSLSPIQVHDLQKGKLLNLLYDGIDTLERYYSGYMPQLFKVALVPLFFLVCIFPRDWTSGLIMFGTLPLIPIFMILIGKWTKKASVRQWILLTQFTGFLQDVLQGLETLKSLGRSKRQGEKINEVSEAYRKTTFQVQRWAFISSLTLELVATISIALVAVGLGLRLANGSLTFLTAFFVLLLAPEYYQPLRTLSSYFHASLDAQEASKSLYDFFELPVMGMVSGDHALDHIECIRFENVSFHYEDSDIDAVRGVSLTLNKGESIAFVGDSGGGKSTLLLLALGLLVPTKGRIYINEQPMDYWDMHAYHQHCSVVLQKPYIFQGSVLQNIAFSGSLNDAEKARATTLAQQVGLSELLKTAPNGLETIIGQGGQDLSGGQLALLLVSRALYKDGDMLFFDEMTDNLDLESEQHVVQALTNLLKERGSWIIAHRLQTLKYVDRIYVMKQGAIVETGNYEQIMGGQRSQNEGEVLS